MHFKKTSSVSYSKPPKKMIAFRYHLQYNNNIIMSNNRFINITVRTYYVCDNSFSTRRTSLNVETCKLAPLLFYNQTLRSNLRASSNSNRTTINYSY